MPNGKGYLVAADEGKGLVMYQRSEGNEYVNTMTIEGIDETKALAIAPDAFWLANTELEAPVYEKLSVSDIGSYLQQENVELADLISHRDLTVDGVRLVKASGETTEVDDDGDAADDPAFWLNTDSPENSLIIATNKQGGLMAYDLGGKELQYLEEGKPNNVDVREVTVGSKKIALAAASNREYNTIALYKIQEKNDQQEPIIKLNAVGDSVHSEVAELASNLSEVYGLCMYYDGSSPYVFINGKSGKVEQWKLSLDGDNVEGSLVRTFSVDSQPEGCVADDETDTLYLGEENIGIWSFSAQENSGTDAVEIARIDNAALTADVEGLTIFDTGSDKYLIASSQGSNSYAAYDLNDGNKLKGTFAIIGDDSKNIDGASDTDGIHAVFADFGPDYPEGMFIAQDWNNINADYEAENQNFKMVSMKEILDSL